LLGFAALSTNLRFNRLCDGGGQITHLNQIIIDGMLQGYFVRVGWCGNADKFARGYIGIHEQNSV